MFLKCQNFYTLGVEEYFTKTGDFTWMVSDCEELVGVTHRRWCWITYQNKYLRYEVLH